MHGSASSTFWQTWESGARTALPNCTSELVYMPMDYDVSGTAQAITDYCSVADGFVVTIPYVNVTNIRLVLASLNACYAQRPDVKVMLTNTDQAYRAHEWGYLDLYSLQLYMNMKKIWF